jgi:hypothetical protein
MMTFSKWIAFGMRALGVTACSFTGPAPNRDADIIVVGDSILAWHRNSARSIPSFVAQLSGLTVSDVSIRSAPFLGPNGIPTQYVASDWDWVIARKGRSLGRDTPRFAVSLPATVLPIPCNCQASAAVLPLLVAIQVLEQ